MLNLLDKLKTLAENVSILSNNKVEANNTTNNITNNHFHIEIPDSLPIPISESKQLSELIKQLPDLKEGYLLATPKVSEKLSLIEEYSKSGDDKELIEFIDSNLPEKDKSIWYASLMLRRKFKKGENIENIKNNIIVNHKDRGKNIANLCSANYLEDYIIPLFDYLKETGGGVKSFMKIYETIVMECPTAVFVSRSKKYSIIKNEVFQKIKMVEKYGHKKVALHGIGEDNVETVKKLVIEVEQKCTEIKSTDLDSHYSGGKIITATFNLK